MNYKILVVDDSPEDLEKTKSILEPHKYRIDTAESGETAIEIMSRSRGEYALVIVDYMMTGISGAQTTEELLRVHQDLNVIVLSKDQSRDSFKESVYSGARRYVDKWDEASLLKEVNDWYRQYEDAHHVVANSAELQENEKRIRSFGMVGCSTGIAKVVDLVEKFVSKPYDVRVEGETGVGKERIARALYKGDPRKLITVNCADFKNGDMMKSELFGHEKGAFTGATGDKTGLFEEADGGMIVLDELHTLGLDAQEALLRVLQEKKVRPVGGNREYPINIRVVVLCKPDLKERVDRGEVREDFYERVNVLVIRVPPLRERKEDVPLLATHFLQKWEQENKSRKSFLLGAIRELQNYDWPRNVRQLENLINRVASIVDGEKITKKDIKEQIETESKSDLGFREQVDNITREKLVQAIKIAKQEHLSIRKAASVAGFSYTTFRRKLSQYSLHFPGL